MESEKPRSRKELREMERQSHRRLPRLHLSNAKNEKKLAIEAPRLALLGFLASVTVVAPLTGIITPDLSIAAPSPDFTTNETLLSVVASAEDMSGYDSDLNAVPASSRSRLLEAQQLGNCVSKEDSANGDIKAATPEETLVWPMLSGSYRYSSPWGVRVHPFWARA